MGELPARTTTEPIPAFKYAHITVHGDAMRFEPSVFKELRYDREATAHCHLIDHHQVPDTSHGCGFYGLKDPAGTFNIVTPFHLEVEFAGKVIGCDLGYRAQHQRVLSVTVQRGCSLKPTLLHPTFGWNLAPSCDHPATRIILNPGTYCLAAQCELHAQQEPGIEYTIEQLAEGLRTEVRWAE